MKRVRKIEFYGFCEIAFILLILPTNLNKSGPFELPNYAHTYSILHKTKTTSFKTLFLRTSGYFKFARSSVFVDIFQEN